MANSDLVLSAGGYLLIEQCIDEEVTAIAIATGDGMDAGDLNSEIGKHAHAIRLGFVHADFDQAEDVTAEVTEAIIEWWDHADDWRPCEFVASSGEFDRVVRDRADEIAEAELADRQMHADYRSAVR